MHYIKAGYGFNVGQDFARAAVDTTIEISPDDKRPGGSFGLIPADPTSPLGFLKYGNREGKIRVFVSTMALGTKEAAR